MNISIKGARVHNLKNISLEIPRDKLVCVTGLSGSGKSSLAFDTIYAEGQRRYVESLSSYARQFLGLMDKPDVDRIDGLSPAISIDQKSVSHNPRSTVGTVTEIYDYLRLLFARVGHPHCPECGDEVVKQTKEQIIKKILEIKKGTRIILLAPVIKDQKGEHKSLLRQLQKMGFVRVRFDGDFLTIEEVLDRNIEKYVKHNIEVVIDRLEINSKSETLNSKQIQNPNNQNTKLNKPEDEFLSRLFQSLETALELGNGLITIHEPDTDKEHIFSQHFACPKCDINLPEIEPRMFSFNSPRGACSECTGLGTKLEIDPELVIPNKRLTIAQGAIRPWSRVGGAGQTWQMKILEQVAAKHGFSIHTPVQEMSKKYLDVVLYGTSKQVKVDYDSDSFQGSYNANYEGVINNLYRRHKDTDSDYIRREIEKYMRILPCPSCQGKRLKPEALSVTVVGMNIYDVVSMTIQEAAGFFKGLTANKAQETERAKKDNDKDKLGLGYPKPSLSLSEREMTIARQILKEINSRLGFLNNVGLNYLTLDRSAYTLSGGEAQRIRLATQIGSSLTGVLYVLDEPSIGLHQKDNHKLIHTLKELRDLGNSVIVVEHDEATMMAADQLIDIGPGAGKHGGLIIAQGTAAQIKKNKKSLTGQYLSGTKKIETPKKYRQGNGKSLKIINAQEHNLKKINVEIPLAKLVCITGVSGSGKSTLMTDILSKALSQHFYQSKDNPGKHKEIKGLKNIDKVITIDQSPIGRTPRSNPATYTGLFTPIRDLYTELPEAKMRGYRAGRFSFNVKGGRCEACEGDGMVKIEMNFLPDVYVECEECHGQRYNREVLEIHYKGKSIADVLDMTVEEAGEYFQNIPSIKNKLDILNDVGLGYIHLGQPAPTLSGGEAQRVKLATELSRRATGKTLYILDEPTTGLHFDDIKKLLTVLHRLVDKGNTVLIIEHNLDIVKSADWIIDLGPEGGDKGGYIIATGTPKDIVKVKQSYTGQFLKKVLE